MVGGLAGVPDVGVASMAGPLRRVAMRRPGALLSADPTRWHYGKVLDPVALVEQYEVFVGLIEASGAEIVWFGDDDADDLADSVFTYDPSFMTPAGAVVMAPGKDLRKAEAELHRAFYHDHDIPIVGEISGAGLIEGGDCFWLDESTIAVGRGFRTNQEGIDQLADIVAAQRIELRVFDLPYHQGPEACLHLLSLVSPLDRDLALIHAPLLPTALWQLMLELGYELIEAPAAEFDASFGLNLNVLATAPRTLIAVDGFPHTVARMREAGCDVDVFAADELCIPCEGGPTCLTRPLWRT